jgi:cytochrome c peroxidase
MDGPSPPFSVLKRVFPIAALALMAFSCGTRNKAVRPVGGVVQIKPPLGLPAVPIPASDPPTADTIALGQRLFYDVRLSRDSLISCASCHNPHLGFADGQSGSQGFGGIRGSRNAPTILNAAYNVMQFWDGRAASLEEQVGGPIANPIEMNLPHELAVARLNADPGYRQEFERAFGAGPVTMAKVEESIASFERTLLSGNSPFDRYVYGADKTAMSPAAIRGLAVFTDKKRGNCVTCHTVGEEYALFTDGKFHNLGIGLDRTGQLTDLGRFVQTKAEADKGAFLTPSLRNVALTAPYMHDGSAKTLKDVVDFYVGGGNSNPQLDKEIKETKLTFEERADLVAFLDALTGDQPVGAGPRAAK